MYGNEQQGRFLTVFTRSREPNSIEYDYYKVLYGAKLSEDIKNNIFARSLGNKAYELKDHLGNVRVTFSDIKMPTGYPSQPFTVDLLSKNEYFPYGMKINELSYNNGSTRYGYNGTHEQDREMNADGNHLSFGDFGYDTRVARR